MQEENQVDDGGKSFAYIKSQYPEAEKMTKDYHSLDEDERVYITEWYKNGRGKPKWPGMVVIVCNLILIVCFMVGISAGRADMIMSFLVEILLIDGVWAIVVHCNNQEDMRRLQAINFNAVQEVIFIKYEPGHRGHPVNYVYAWQWDEDRGKFYETRMKTKFAVRLYEGDIMYHPCGVEEYIP